VTVAPGSAVPVTALPLGATLAVGAVGSVLSGAVTSVGKLALPAASLALTSTVSPLVRAGLSTML
jgi:hypothetical protein